MSGINSLTSFISEFVYHILKNCCPLPKSNVKNSFELIKKLKNTAIPEDYILVSLDVVSMFSNVS